VAPVRIAMFLQSSFQLPVVQQRNGIFQSSLCSLCHFHCTFTAHFSARKYWECFLNEPHHHITLAFTMGHRGLGCPRSTNRCSHCHHCCAMQNITHQQWQITDIITVARVGYILCDMTPFTAVLT
jgi:hypothetical protein